MDASRLDGIPIGRVARSNSVHTLRGISVRLCAHGPSGGPKGGIGPPRHIKIEPVLPPFRSFVLVSREQIARNYRNVCSVVGPKVDVAGVVKADAYGHGALEVSRVLVKEGALWLAVSSVDEGAALRCGGIRETRILVMGGFLPFESQALVEHDLTPAVHSLVQLRDLDRLAEKV